MNTPSEEQQSVIDSISDGNNVIVNACAGSGKSTTILSCAKALPQYNFINLTFNKALQTEEWPKVVGKPTSQLRFRLLPNVEYVSDAGLANAETSYQHHSVWYDARVPTS